MILTINHKILFQLSPLLIVYVLVFMLGYEDGFRKDEIRHVFYAENLLNGFYSPSDVEFIWNGPGYPIFLMPFIAVNASFFAIRFFNVILLFASVWLVLKGLSCYLTQKKALLVACLFGLYWPIWGELGLMMTEIF